MSDCIFCKIIAGEIPSKKLAETKDAIAIMDITPHAPFHALMIPRRHVASLNDLSASDRRELLPALYDLADQVATEQGFRERGYRCVINNQEEAGQTVFHLHLHLLAKGKLQGRLG